MGTRYNPPPAPSTPAWTRGAGAANTPVRPTGPAGSVWSRVPSTANTGSWAERNAERVKDARAIHEKAVQEAVAEVPKPPYNWDALDANTITYNVGMPKTAYFSESARRRYAGNNRSNAPITVNNPKQLWTKDGGHKGMILIHVTPNVSSSMENTDIPLDKVKSAMKAQKRYGFQFHYNPQQIVMTYGSYDKVDPGYELSGKDPFSLPPSAANSIINIDIPLNRIEDMKFFDPKTKLLRPEFAGATGGLYAPRTPDTTEQKSIYTRGTMYDVEYLLATVLRHKRDTNLLGLTSDLGFFFPTPIEIHLGPGMRYTALLQTVSVTHGRFNERMVPTLSTLSLGLGRVADVVGR